MMVPHSVITVSLATALLPRLSDLAVDRNFALVRDRLVSAVRTCLALIVPIAALLAALAGPLAAVLFGYGAAAGDTSELAFTLIALLPGLVAFTTHYMVLRGFYALQDTRTPFFVQLWVSGTMAVAALLIGRAEHAHTTVLLALGYSLAYVVGALVSVGSLGRRLGGIPRWPLVRHILWLFVPAGIGALAAYGLVWLGDDVLDGLPWRFGELVSLAAGSLLGIALFVGFAYLMRIDEVHEAVGIVRSRLGRRRPSMDSHGSPGRGADAAADPTPRSTPGEQ
jgi:putative peptidoglycan lipid II flippase